MPNSIIDVFNEYFEMVPANSEELKKEVYKLRYQVYCVENEFLDSTHYQEAMESDEFDSHSCHYLIYHRKLNVYMATTRLILPDKNNPDKLFPIEIHSKIDKTDALTNVSRHSLAEASRFCISKEFRRRKNEFPMNSKHENTFTLDERRIFPHITLALFACLIKISYDHGIKDWFAVMEPALIRFFTMLGINFNEIGPLTDYHGKRQPCIINVDNLLEGVANKDESKWNMLTNKGSFWN
jgi:N-acyl amino acid synthase of PEP-CTERM/exosortase system